MDKKIVIMGGGIGGLSAAYYLAKMGFTDITLIEKNKEYGGQARSGTTEDNKHSEYCWHALGGGYKLMNGIMKEIPLGPASVEDATADMKEFIYCRTDLYKHTDTELFSNLAGPRIFFERLRSYGYKVGLVDILAFLWIYLLTFLPEALLTRWYDNTTWVHLCRWFNPELQNLLVTSPSIYLGMDWTKFSAAQMLCLMRRNTKSAGKFSFKVFLGPTNEIFIDPMVVHLQTLGVEFLRGKVVRCGPNYVVYKYKKQFTTLHADIIINALSVEQYAQVLARSGCEDPDITLLVELGRQIQTQVAFEIANKVKSTEISPIIVLFDSPWYLMIKCEGKSWGLANELLSCGIGIADRPGLNGKTMLECTTEEVIEECWRQIQYFGGKVELETNDGSSKTLADIAYESANIWHSFVNNPTITTWEPKYSNGVGQIRLQPDIATRYKIDGRETTIYSATSYTEKRAKIFNMESAVESAKKVADQIARKK